MPANDEAARDLTSGANSVLEEYLRDVRESIVRQASFEAARRLGATAEVGVAEIVNAIERNQIGSSVRKPTEARTRYLTLLRIYALFGAVMVPTGLLYYLVASDGISAAARNSLVIAGAGLLLSVLSLGAVQVLQYRHGPASLARDPGWSAQSDVLQAWARFEVAARAQVASEVGESRAASLSLSEVLNQLKSSGMVSAAELSSMNRLLSARNGIVHGIGSVEASPEDLDRVQHLAERLVR